MAKQNQIDKGFQREQGIYIPVRKRLYTLKEAAEYLGLASKTLRNRIGPKAPNPFPVKPKRIGKKVLFDIRDLNLYVDSLPTT